MSTTFKRQGRWSETLPLQSSDAGNLYDVDVDDREALITSRPWFVWELEVAEEEVRVERNPEQSSIDVCYPARVNVKARWKEYWKDDWGDTPGRKWKHESPSPEPPDPNEMEFTPSEIDALDAIPPPTPPSPSKHCLSIPTSIPFLLALQHSFSVTKQLATSALSQKGEQSPRS